MKMDATIYSETLVSLCRDTYYHKNPYLHSLEIDLLSKWLTIYKTQVCWFIRNWNGCKDKVALIAIMPTTFCRPHWVWSNNRELTDLNFSTPHSVTQCKVTCGCSTDEHALGHCRQSSANVSVTVNITSCVCIAHCMGFRNTATYGRSYTSTVRFHL